MSAEKPKIRNFTGLSGFEKLAKSLQLIVNKGYGDVIEMSPFDSMTVSPPDFRDLGLSLRLREENKGSDPQESLPTSSEAAKAARLKEDDVDLVLVAESGFLRSREILSKVSLSEVTKRQELASWKGPRPDAMMDRKHGFEIKAFFVLNKELDAEPLRPRRLGTILAESSFLIRPNRMGSGLLPQPLTEEVRTQNGLKKGTVFFVDHRAPLFDSETESLDDAITVYIEEEIHSDLGRLRTREAKLLQATFAIQGLGQLIFFAARELESRPVTEEQAETPVGRFLHSQIKKHWDKDLTGQQALNLIKADPGKIAGQLTAQLRLKEQYRNLLIMEEDES